MPTASRAAGSRPIRRGLPPKRSERRFRKPSRPKATSAEVKGELKGDIAELKGDIAAVKADIAALKGEIAAVETRLDAKIDVKISGLEARFVSELHSTIYKGVAVLGGLIVIVSGAAAFVAKVLN